MAQVRPHFQSLHLFSHLSLHLSISPPHLYHGQNLGKLLFQLRYPHTVTLSVGSQVPFRYMFRILVSGSMVPWDGGWILMKTVILCSVLFFSFLILAHVEVCGIHTYRHVFVCIWAPMSVYIHLCGCEQGPWGWMWVSSSVAVYFLIYWDRVSYWT